MGFFPWIIPHIYVDNVENVDKEKSINYVKLEKWRI